MTLETGDNYLRVTIFRPKELLLKPGGMVEQVPFKSGSVSVSGYIVIKNENLDEAIAIAQKCPILSGENTSVEIRALASPGQ